MQFEDAKEAEEEDWEDVMEEMDDIWMREPAGARLWPLGTTGLWAALTLVRLLSP